MASERDRFVLYIQSPITGFRIYYQREMVGAHSDKDQVTAAIPLIGPRDIEEAVRTFVKLDAGSKMIDDGWSLHVVNVTSLSVPPWHQEEAEADKDVGS